MAALLPPARVMRPLHLLLGGLALGFIVWQARRAPLAGGRRLTVLGLRLAAVILACLALWGVGRRSRQHVQPQHVLYLVDRSASMDAAQAAWIARRIASLEALRPASVPRAVGVFGAQAVLVEPFGTARLEEPAAISRLLGGAGVPPERTDLERALLDAAGWLPPAQGGRVILFSDGRETAGDANRVLAHVRRLGLSVFPARVPTTAAAATRWASLVVPPVVQQGASVGVQLALHHDGEAPARVQVTVALAGVPVRRERVLLRPGWQVVAVPVPALQQGGMALDVWLESAGGEWQERRRAYTEVEGPPHLLFVTPQPSSLPLLAAALRRRQIEVSIARPADVPTQALGLTEYDGVLLAGVPKSVFTPAQADALRDYLERLGGGLVMVGLGGDLAQEVATTAPLDALLPVTYEAKGLQEAHRRVCMVLLIDRSASMIGPRIAATKRAAVELITQLSDEDLVGVFAFDTKPYVLMEVQPVGRARREIVDKLARLRSTGGTDVFPALEIAQGRLNATDATVKHIILLSDGNTPFEAPAYRELAQAMRAERITISTIGIGAAFINSDYLQWLAEATGGTFYVLRSLEELPRLIAQDAREALGQLPFTEGYYRPEREAASDWFADIPAWPVLRGYLTTTAKPQARVDMTVRAGETPDPLLARWTLGQGRVAAFTSDADTRWSPEWVAWPHFEAWWAQVVRWAMRPTFSEELLVWVDESQGAPRLMVEGLLEAPQGHLVPADGGEGQPVALVRSGPWRWSAPLDGWPSGWYQLVLESRQADAPVFAKRWVQIGSPLADAEERPGQPPQEALLGYVAQATAGVMDVPDRAFVPPTTVAVTEQPLSTWWLPLVILLLLIDVALRGSSML
jgi:Mg-chelatase subunit ChlD